MSHQRIPHWQYLLRKIGQIEPDNSRVAAECTEVLAQSTDIIIPQDAVEPLTKALDAKIQEFSGNTSGAASMTVQHLESARTAISRCADSGEKKVA